MYTNNEKQFKYIKKIVFQLIDGTKVEAEGEEATHLYNFVLEDNNIMHIEFAIEGVRRLVPRAAIAYVDVLENKKANQFAWHMNRLYNVICELGSIKEDDYRWTYWFVEKGQLYFDFSDGPIVLSSDPTVVELAEKLLGYQQKLDKILLPAQQKEIV